MKIVINGLSEQSLLKAARRVEWYQRHLLVKNREFIKELTKKGIEEAHIHLNGMGDSEPPTFATENPYVMVGSQEGNMRSTIKLRGEDVAFVEFGAGIHYNQVPVGDSPNPLGVELGYTIGSYGMGQGANDTWIYEKDGHTYVSFGTQATMPLYNADMKIRQEYRDVARSVFRG